MIDHVHVAGRSVKKGAEALSICGKDRKAQGDHLRLLRKDSSMSPTSAHVSRRFSRLAAGLSIAAASAAGVMLTAVPAHAQTPAVEAVVLAFDELRITGSESRDAIVVSGAGPFFVSNSLGSIKAGPGCVPDGSRVRCDKVKTVRVFAKGGDDSVRNSTPLASELQGGGGNDRLTGSFTANDFISGAVGAGDIADGRGGFDTCFAETESNCEK